MMFRIEDFSSNKDNTLFSFEMTRISCHFELFPKEIARNLKYCNRLNRRTGESHCLFQGKFIGQIQFCFHLFPIDHCR